MTSSLGNQEKFKDNGNWFKIDAFGYEGLAERLTSDFYSHWNKKIQYVQYMEQEFENGLRGCISADFLSADEEILTLARILERLGININKFYKNKSTVEQVEISLNVLYNHLGVDAATYFAHQFTLDAFVMNEDRHLNNIIFIRNIVTGQINPGPLFDHGMGLLARTTAFPLRDSTLSLVKRVKCQPFSVDFSKQAAAIQSLTGFVPEIPKEAFDCIYSVTSGLYTNLEVARAVRVLRYSEKTVKFNWRLMR